MTGPDGNRSTRAPDDTRMAQDRYRILFERSPDAVVVIAPEGTFLDFNPVTPRFFGVTQDDLREAMISDFYADRQAYHELIEQVNQAALVHNAPTDLVDRRGRIKHCRVTSMRLDGPDGHVYGYQILIRDVTGKRRAERNLHSQKNFADQLIDNAPEAIAIIGQDDRVIRVNEEFCRLFQHVKADCIDRRMEELTVPPHLKEESLSFCAAVMNGDSVEAETQRMRKDGSLVEVSILAKPIATEQDASAVYVVYRDITALKRDQEALRKSEQRHRTVLEAAPDPVIVRDMDDRVTYLNPAFSRVFGWRIEECLGRPLDFIPRQNLPETKSFMQYIRQGQAFSGIETQRFTKTGEVVDVSISAAVFLDADGDPEGYVMTLQDISERLKKDEALRHVAYHDTLTGLPNRKAFYMRLDDLLHQSNRRYADRGWAMMFLDLDKFKQVNDTLGHDTGDRLLETATDRLRGCLRETDHLFRLGGDEFTIILNQLGQDLDVARVARKILLSLSRPFHINGHEIFTSTSIGISLFPGDGWEVEGLVKNADMAMYAAKEAGGNGYRFFTEEMNRRALHRMQMESSLRKALERNELLLYYQPLVDRAHRIVGLEALLRWNHPEQGLILPSTFIRISEETGIIVPVGRWVLETACTQTRHWHEMGYRDLFVSVNLTARQLQEPDFEQMVLDVIDRSGLPPACLRLEVTESGMMQNPEACIRKMKTLRARGVTFAIDDFGTGYSSLSHLKRLPIDSLKIDRSFITDALKNKGDQEIIRTIITMARNLNIDTVAEGVETEQQRDLLTDFGCDGMQGYLFAQPLPGERFRQLLERQASAAVVSAEESG